jgi:hypothetical protein
MNSSERYEKWLKTIKTAQRKHPGHVLFMVRQFARTHGHRETVRMIHEVEKGETFATRLARTKAGRNYFGTAGEKHVTVASIIQTAPNRMRDAALKISTMLLMRQERTLLPYLAQRTRVQG